MSEMRYSKDHEWIRIEGQDGTVGITEHAQQQLGDLVFVELPEIGRAVQQGEECAVVESVKAASEVYAPITGTITEINQPLPDDPGLVNREAEAGGWLFKMSIGNPAELEELMDKEAYAQFVAEEA